MYPLPQLYGATFIGTFIFRGWGAHCQGLDDAFKKTFTIPAKSLWRECRSAIGAGSHTQGGLSRSYQTVCKGCTRTHKWKYVYIYIHTHAYTYVEQKQQQHTGPCLGLRKRMLLAVRDRLILGNLQISSRGTHKFACQDQNSNSPFDALKYEAKGFPSDPNSPI